MGAVFRRGSVLALMGLVALAAGCKSKQPAPEKEPAAGPDAGPAARTKVTPQPSTQAGKVAQEVARAEHEHVHPRPLVPCPVADRYDLDAVLDEAAKRYDSGELEAALACAEQAVRLSPRSVEAHHDRAAALAALERWDEARQAFVMALAVDPDDPLTLVGAADLYINRLGPDRDLTAIGLEYARRGAAHAGRRRGDSVLQGRLALLEAQALDDLGMSDEALPRAEAAVKLMPDSVEALYERAVILFHLCRFDRARAAFAELAEKIPDDPFVHHHLGLIFEREGRSADAERHFRKGRKLAPEIFHAPVLLPPREFQKLVDEAVAELSPETQKLLEQVALEIADLPALEDLTAVDPPFAPTILGLYRGTPLGVPDRSARPEPRAIVLYRKNLARAVKTRAELEKQVRITLWHEIGHLTGEDEDELRARGLE